MVSRCFVPSCVGALLVALAVACGGNVVVDPGTGAASGAGATTSTGCEEDVRRLRRVLREPVVRRCSVGGPVSGHLQLEVLPAHGLQAGVGQRVELWVDGPPMLAARV
jgi:hypothetical protein